MKTIISKVVPFVLLAVNLPAFAFESSTWEGRYSRVGRAKGCPAELLVSFSQSSLGPDLVISSIESETPFQWEVRMGHEVSSEALDDAHRPWVKTVDTEVTDMTISERIVWERCSMVLGFINCWSKDLRIRTRSLNRNSDGFEMVEQFATGNVTTSGQRRCAYRQE